MQARKERRYIKTLLSRIESFIRGLDLDSEIDPEEILVRLERLERTIQEFSELHKRLIISMDKGCQRRMKTRKSN